MKTNENEIKKAKEKLENSKFMAEFLGLKKGSNAYFGFIEEDLINLQDVQTKLLPLSNRGGIK